MSNDSFSSSTWGARNLRVLPGLHFFPIPTPRPLLFLFRRASWGVRFGPATAGCQQGPTLAFGVCEGLQRRHGPAQESIACFWPGRSLFLHGLGSRWPGWCQRSPQFSGHFLAIWAFNTCLNTVQPSPFPGTERHLVLFSRRIGEHLKTVQMAETCRNKHPPRRRNMAKEDLQMVATWRWVLGLHRRCLESFRVAIVFFKHGVSPKSGFQKVQLSKWKLDTFLNGPPRNLEKSWTLCVKRWLRQHIPY